MRMPDLPIMIRSSGLHRGQYLYFFTRKAGKLSTRAEVIGRVDVTEDLASSSSVSICTFVPVKYVK